MQIYIHCIWNCIFWYFLAIVETFIEENVFKVFLYSCCFFYPETINFHKSGIVGNVLLIRLQYTLSFKWPDFDFKGLVTITPIGYSIKFKASVWNFIISETGRNYNSLFKLAGNNWVEQSKIVEQKVKIGYSWACTFWAS